MSTADASSLCGLALASTSQQFGADTVLLNASHSHLKQQFSEMRFSQRASIMRVKEQLQVKTGTAVEFMQLQLKDPDGQTLVGALEDDRLLGFYSPVNGYWLHVIDHNPNSLHVGGGFEDLSQVEKYVMSEEDYEKRSESYRKFKKTMMANDPTWTIGKYMAVKSGQDVPQLPDGPVIDENYGADFAKDVRVGDRCEVDLGGKRGVVSFVGRVEGLPPGFWVGVVYDEPVGKHDGTVKGKRYFDCPPGHGGMVRPDHVKTGDFPERDPFEEDEDEI
ncbi:hypothetical protein CBR_g30186 [Chara braunii]|uniref:CAP-Gly domain-containing protein n=1 Tax=Chara braunii TaxID=69332 RepID=A0A388LC86_CHABU|nr:hypothetical protein CBR_g30186 [Chara braunii]|eukprot:GBG79921.1 hypothetical protein CBR_g30186 [Chara braunii]